MEKKLYFDFNTTQKILNKIAWIDRFKGKWQAISSNDNQYLKELRRESVVASLVAYTRLGGANRSNKDIQKLLGTIQNSDLTSQKNRDIFGYSRILESIINNYHIICFDETYIYHIHSFLFKNTINDSEQSGTSKNHPYKVVAKYPDGQKRVIVTNSLCFSVKVEIYELFRWTIRAFKESHIHPLLIIALFVYEFLSIQPFHSGNGHISRLLTLFLLLKHGYSYFQYVSFEELIEKRKDEYQSALKKCQKERGEGKNEIIDKWAIFFIDCIFDLT
ncbi:MAG: Fic family protein, partial [Chitinispirillia bacterium]